MFASTFYPMQREATPTHAAPQSYSTTQVAALMSVNRQTINRWVAAGRIDAFNIGSTDRPRIRITRAALDAFIAANDLSATA